MEQYEESLRVLASEGFCAPGEYPWDFWQARALAAGVSPELARQGREVMRESHQHDWDPVLKWLCGWNNDGKDMIALALEPSARAHSIWTLLMETDGFRGNCHPQSHEWISWI